MQYILAVHNESVVSIPVVCVFIESVTPDGMWNDAAVYRTSNFLCLRRESILKVVIKSRILVFCGVSADFFP
jgi:hypothetical protein